METVAVNGKRGLTIVDGSLLLKLLTVRIQDVVRVLDWCHKMVKLSMNIV